MLTNDYQKLAMRTEADQEAILNHLVKMGPDAMRLDNGARGLAGDAGEVSSAVMKFIEYRRPLDLTNLVEECGDCLWRIAQILSAVGVSMEECMEANIAKLQIRYPEKYSDDRSANRNKEAEMRAVSHTVDNHDNGRSTPGFGYADVGGEG